MTEFSKDELDAPSWLDQSFFERALRSFEHDPTIEVQNFVITPGTAPGEHFASVMYRIDVTYSSKKYKSEGKNIKLIMKTYPVDAGLKMDMLKSTPAFKNEILMYTKILPEMERILKDAGSETILAPKFVYGSLTAEVLPVIVLVDVSPDGFQTFDHNGVKDFDILSVIVKKLAKFHAASLCIQENEGNLHEFDQHVLINDDLENNGMKIKDIFSNGYNTLVSQMATWGPNFKVFCEKMEGKYEYFHEKSKILKRETPYKVLCHGDFHSKNLLFRNGCLKDEDMLLVDHQFPIWAPPTFDLVYLFNIVTHSDLVDTRRNDIIHLYYNEFSTILKKSSFRGKIPSLMDLQIELVYAASMEFLQSTCFVPLRFVDMTKIDFNEMLTNPEAAKEMALIGYRNPAFQEYCLRKFTRSLYLGAMD